MSDVASELKPLQVGHKLAGRYEILEDQGERQGARHYAAKDLEEHGCACVVSQIGRPKKEAEAEKMKRNLERAHRVASWIRTPGALIPKDFLYEDECLFSVLPPAYPHTVAEFISSDAPAVNVLVGWVLELAGVLEIFHDARQPQFIGQLPLENLRVDDEKRIQLIGFDLTPDFKLEYTSLDSEFAKAPDEKFEARSDVWVLGTLIQKMVDISKDPVKKAFKAENDLRNLVAQMTNSEIDKRVTNMATLKTRLERISWSKTKLSNTGITDAPINVYTVEEKSQTAKWLEENRKYVLGGLAAVLGFIALLQFIFPPNLD